jgi:hypothetical protein
MTTVDVISQDTTHIRENKSDDCVTKALNTKNKKVPNVALIIHLTSLEKDDPRQARYPPNVESNIAPIMTPSKRTFLYAMFKSR